MINGAHCVVYSKDAEADREFLRDVLELPYVDSGGGWLIFALPPSEVAVHPGDNNSVHELFLMCDDVDQTVSRLEDMRVDCEDISEAPWGRLTYVTLPGGGRLGLYQPTHERPEHGT